MVLKPPTHPSPPGRLCYTRAMSALAGRNVLLGVTGGIAAYKAAELTRALRAAGAAVRVVMTASAQDFIGPLTLQALSGERVRSELLDSEAEAAMGHIELARWADVVLIAPASADTMARLAHGHADDLLTTVCLATEAPLVLAPAMNRVMWAHAATRANAAVLAERGATILGPDSGDQACGETGSGRMREPTDLVADLAALWGGDRSLAGDRVLITAGPTREAIDPVRYLSNHSSGRMGFAIAAAAARAGARVTLVAGPVERPTPPGVERVDVTSAADMLAAVEERVAAATIFIATAAVADYRPLTVAADKIKKEGHSEADIRLTANPDILARVAARPDAPLTVGFAAETRDAATHARAKRRDKGVDLICANTVGGGAGFGDVDSELAVFWDGGEQRLGPAPKESLARELVALVATFGRGDVPHAAGAG